MKRTSPVLQMQTKSVYFLLFVRRHRYLLRLRSPPQNGARVHGSDRQGMEMCLIMQVTPTGCILCFTSALMHTTVNSVTGGPRVCDLNIRGSPAACPPRLLVTQPDWRLCSSNPTCWLFRVKTFHNLMWVFATFQIQPSWREKRKHVWRARRSAEGGRREPDWSLTAEACTRLNAPLPCLRGCAASALINNCWRIDSLCFSHKDQEQKSKLTTGLSGDEIPWSAHLEATGGGSGLVWVVLHH